MDRPTFTKEQENWICEKITEWYSLWKGQIMPEKVELSLMAIDFLKAVVCNDTAYIDKFNKTYPNTKKEKNKIK